MSEKTIVFLKGFALGRGFNQTLKLINAASFLHEGQTRKSGEPYIEHPITVAAYLQSLGINDDVTLAASVGHDIFEDCDITEAYFKSRFGVDDEVIGIMKTLTKVEGLSTQLYYNLISKDIRASLIKIADRCHNVSTMAGVFSIEKVKQYIQETYDYVIPLIKHVKHYHPEYSDQVYIMKMQLESNCKGFEALIKYFEQEKTESA
jgi:GTP pyrophosphokinase